MRLGLATLLLFGVMLGSEFSGSPAQAFVPMEEEGQPGFQGFVDGLNIDVCWNASLPPIWVEATRRALVAWNAATPAVRFRSLRPVQSAVYPAGCDVFVNNELADFDKTKPGIDPLTGLPAPVEGSDGLISASEGETRAIGGRTVTHIGSGSTSTWVSQRGFVKVNSQAPKMQGRSVLDLASFQGTMLHELGHVIGLDHTEEINKGSSVMTSHGNLFLIPQPDDIAGMNFIYSTVTAARPPAGDFVTTDPVTSMTEAYWPVTPELPTAPVEEPTIEPTTEPAAESDASEVDSSSEETSTDEKSGAAAAEPMTESPSASMPEGPERADPQSDGHIDASRPSPTQRTVVLPPSPISIVAIEAGVLLCLLALLLTGIRRRRNR